MILRGSGGREATRIRPGIWGAAAPPEECENQYVVLFVAKGQVRLCPEGARVLVAAGSPRCFKFAALYVLRTCGPCQISTRDVGQQRSHIARRASFSFGCIGSAVSRSGVNEE